MSIGFVKKMMISKVVHENARKKIEKTIDEIYKNILDF